MRRASLEGSPKLNFLVIMLCCAQFTSQIGMKVCPCMMRCDVSECVLPYRPRSDLFGVRLRSFAFIICVCWPASCGQCLCPCCPQAWLCRPRVFFCLHARSKPIPDSRQLPAPAAQLTSTASARDLPLSPPTIAPAFRSTHFVYSNDQVNRYLPSRTLGTEHPKVMTCRRNLSCLLRIVASLGSQLLQDTPST